MTKLDFDLTDEVAALNNLDDSIATTESQRHNGSNAIVDPTPISTSSNQAVTSEVSSPLLEISNQSDPNVSEIQGMEIVVIFS